MQTGRLGAVDVAAGTSNVVYHVFEEAGNTAVLSVNIVNRDGTNSADFGVCTSTNDSWSDANTIFQGILDANDVYQKGGIFVNSGERIIVRSYQGSLSATVFGTQSVTAAQVPATAEAYVEPVTRTLTMTPDTSIDEGSNISITLATTGVLNGTTIGYTISGVDTSDIGGMSLTGTLTVQNAFASLSIPVTADETPDGADTLVFTLATGESADVLINDTSTAPPAQHITGSGGTESSSGSYNIHTFNTGGTFTIENL